MKREGVMVSDGATRIVNPHKTLEHKILTFTV